MSDFTAKRELLERKLQALLDDMRLLLVYVDDPADLEQALNIVGAAQFCHTEDKPWHSGT